MKKCRRCGYEQFEEEYKSLIGFVDMEMLKDVSVILGLASFIVLIYLGMLMLSTWLGWIGR